MSVKKRYTTVDKQIHKKIHKYQRNRGKKSHPIAGIMT